MRSAVIVVLLLVAYCEARPRFHLNPPRPTFGSRSSYIIGGEDAKLGEFPWQLSQQRLRASGLWSHSCGASLLSSGYALTAAHCVDGASVTTIRLIAGVINSTSSDGVSSDVSSYKKHELYETRSEAYISDDIAILTLTSPIYANGVTILYAKLPDNNDNLFAGRSGIISGWGRTDASNVLPQILQKAAIGVISTDSCNQLLREIYVSGVQVDDTQICLYDDGQKTRSCNGDSGGPFNLDNGSEQAIVAGLSSWSPKNSDSVCITGVPVVYTRTSAFLDWIKTNTA